MTATDEAAAEQVQLAGRASKAFGVSFLNTAASRLGTLAIGVVLARLLGPQQFGTFAVATVVLLAMLSFNELGVSLAVVRWRSDPARITPTVNTLSVAMSTVLVAVVLVTAPAFARAMGDPAAVDVVRVMAFSILIGGVVAAPAALLQRDFRQGRRMAIDQVNTWLGATVSLVLALNGFGAMSLAIGRVSGSVVAAVLFLRWSPLPYRFGFDRQVARELLRFGLPLAGASVVVFAVGYVDQLTVGALLGSTALGFYVLAFNLSSWPVNIFSQPLRSVAPAAFARLQHDPARMNASFAKVLGLLAAVTIPVCLVLSGAAGPAVAFIYGPRWARAAPVLVFLAVLAVARILIELAYDFLVVRGRSRAIFVVQLVWLGCLVPALVLAAHVGGLRAVAVAQAVVALLVVVPLYGWLLHRVGVPVLPLLGRLWPAVLAGVLVGAGALLLARLVPSDLLACALSGVLALAAAACLVSRRRADLRVLRSSDGSATA